MKKGFTLIELLAVIVILAIIALIATPIVLNIIDETKESATLRSAEYYLSAVEQSIMKKNLSAGGSFSPNTCVVQEDGNLLCDETNILEVEVNGETPIYGSVTFEEGKIISHKLRYNENTIVINGELNSKVCKITLDKDNDGIADVGDMITCSTESFHVISNQNGLISMLAQYNLDVGQVYNKDTRTYEEIENPTGIQNSDTKGKINFSTTEYWYHGGQDTFLVDQNYASEGRSHPFVYGDYKNTNGEQQNIIYPYVEAYEEYLKNENVKSADATLISYEQLIELGCEDSSIDGESHVCSFTNDWAFTTYYWSGSVYLYGIWVVRTNDDLVGYVTNIDDYGGVIRSDNECSEKYGVRPVINISVNEL